MLASSKKTAPVVKIFGAKEITTNTIEINESLGEELNIEGYHYIGLKMPAAWDTANITFMVSEKSEDDDGEYMDLYGADGVEIVINAAASRAISVDVVDSALAPWSYIKIRSGTTGTPVVQTAEREIIISLKG